MNSRMRIMILTTSVAALVILLIIISNRPEPASVKAITPVKEVETPFREGATIPLLDTTITTDTQPLLQTKNDGKNTAILNGIVVDTQGNRIVDAVINAVEYDAIESLFSEMKHLGETRSNMNGEFELEFSQERQGVLYTRAIGYAPNRWTRFEAKFDHTAPVTIKLQPARTIECQVVDQLMHPIASARVRIAPGRQRKEDVFIYGEPSITDADGKTTIGGLQLDRGAYIVAEKEGIGRGGTKAEKDDSHVIITLHHGATIKGQVVRADGGEPVENARVEVTNTQEGGFIDMTNEGGFFIIEGAPIGKIFITARKEEENLILRRPSTKPYPADPPHTYEVEIGDVVDNVVVKLSRGNRVYGWIRDEDGKGLEGVRVVRYVGMGTMHPITGEVTDANGYYEFNCLELTQFNGNDLYWAFVDERHVDRVEITDDLVPGDRRIDFNVRNWTASISGTIVDARTKEAIPNHSITAREAGVDKDKARTYRGTTDVNGRYIIDCFPGTFDVSASRYKNMQDHPSMFRNNVVVKDHVTGIDFYLLADTATVRGTVLSPTDVRRVDVELIEVSADNLQTMRTLHSARVEMTGNRTFEFVGAPVNVNLRVVASNWGRLEGYSDTFSLEVGEEHDIGPLIIVEHGSIKGTVTNLDGQPVEVEIKLINRTGPAFPTSDRTQRDRPPRTVSKPDSGMFEILNLLPGRWTLIASSLQDRGNSLYETEVEVRENETSKVIFEVDLPDAESPDSYLRGQVVDSDGNPLKALVEVEITSYENLNTEQGRRARVETSEDGKFEINNLHEGRDYEVEVRLREWGRGVSDRKTFTATPPRKDLKIVFEKLGYIKGRVIFDDTEEPVDKFDLKVERWQWHRDREQWRYNYQMGPVLFMEDGSTAPPGIFLSPGREPGRFKILAHGESFIAKECEPFDLPPGETIELTIRVKRAPSVTGQVVAAETNAPLSGVHLNLYMIDNNGAFVRVEYFNTVKTNKEGKFTLPPLAPGTYRLHVDCPQRVKFNSETFTLSGDSQPPSIEIAVPLAAELEVILTNAHIVGNQKLYITLRSQSSAIEDTGRWTTQKGVVKIKQLCPATYDIIVNMNEQKIEFGEVTLEAGEFKSLSLALPEYFANF